MITQACIPWIFFSYDYYCFLAVIWNLAWLIFISLCDVFVMLDFMKLPSKGFIGFKLHHFIV
jgi:hypothetical protein